MIKKYFKEKKGQKGEVINTKSGNQVLASFKISLVMLDTCLFGFFLSNLLSYQSSWRRCVCLQELLSSV